MSKCPDKNSLYQHHIVQNMSITEMARMYDTGPSVVSSWLKKNDIKVIKRVKKINITRDDLYELYITQKLAARVIAGKYNTSTGIIMKYLRKYNIPLRVGSERNNIPSKPRINTRNIETTNPVSFSKLNNREWLKDKLIRENLGMREIGRILSVSEVLVLKYVRLHKLDILMERYRSLILSILAKQYIADPLVRIKDLLNKTNWVRDIMLSSEIKRLGGTLRHTSDYPDLEFHKQSQGEREVIAFLSEYNSNIIEGYRMPIEGRRKEIDIYLPDYRFGVEFNGIFYHSEAFGYDKNRHLDKLKFANSLGISLFQVWEDDWKNKPEIVKSQLLHRLGKSKSLYARKCSIKSLSGKQSREFLEKNHIQGPAYCQYKYGLFLGDELVAVALFSKDHNGIFTLSRYCNKLYYNVVGGLTKLISHFFRENPSIQEIRSQSHNDWYDGGGYKKSGFEFLHNNPPSYWYLYKGKKYHRSAFTKANIIKKFRLPEEFRNSKTETQLIEYLKNLGVNIYKIWNCGTKTWIKKRGGFMPPL